MGVDMPVKEEHYRTIFEHAPLGMLVYDQQGRVIECNDSMVNMLGSSRKAFIGFDILSMTQDEAVLKAVKDAFEKGMGYFEGEYLSITGKKRAYLRAIFKRLADEGGASSGGVAIIEDITERKKVERALVESENKYRLLVENANEAVVVAQEMIIRFTNAKTTEITGYSAEELCGMPFEKLIHPDDLPMVAERHKKRMAGEAVPNFYNFKVVDKAGRVKVVEINAVAFEWSGKPATLNFLMDVTDRMRVERELGFSHENLAHLFSSVKDFIFVIDRKGSIIEVNDALCKKLGYSKEGIVGREIIEIYPKIRRNEVSGIIESMLAGKDMVCSVPLQRKDGALLEVDSRFYQGRWNGESAVFGISHDMTERMKTEAEFRRNEERFRGFYQAITDGMMHSDVHGKIIDVNDALVGMLGYDRDELIGKNSMEITPERWHDPENQFVHRTVFNKGRGEFDKEYIVNDGSIIPVRVHYWLVRDDKGDPSGVWTLIRDMTERRAAEEEMHKRIFEIEKLNKFMMGRELRIIDMKREINELLARLGEQARYKI